MCLPFYTSCVGAAISTLSSCEATISVWMAHDLLACTKSNKPASICQSCNSKYMHCLEKRRVKAECLYRKLQVDATTKAVCFDWLCKSQAGFNFELPMLGCHVCKQLLYIKNFAYQCETFWTSYRTSRGNSSSHWCWKYVPWRFLQLDRRRYIGCYLGRSVRSRGGATGAVDESLPKLLSGLQVSKLHRSKPASPVSNFLNTFTVFIYRLSSRLCFPYKAGPCE